MSEDVIALIVPHTHWDREWYQTFQQFRMRLVHAVDHVLHVLETDPSFTFFMLDGQTIVLEDYLEIRPENAERLRRFAREGRLLVGPWYLQPDEFLVAGESLIRNLQIGRRMAADYGGAMPIGYVPDTFGHIGQLPQILRGFGLDNAVFWRGVPPDVERGAFRWVAPDGSSVLAVLLYGEYGYSNAASLPLERDALAARIGQIVDQMRPHAIVPTLPLMNGSDHLEPQDGLPQALADAAPLLTEKGIRARIGTLPQYVALIREAQESLATHTGEMTSSYTAHLLPGVFSTRMWLKQRNAACEALLTRWAEPSTYWASLLGMPYPTTLLQHAWRFLLHNHPHDSICGCSIDEVHAEMLPRFAQSEQIAEGLTHDALATLAQQVDTCGPEHAMPLVIFNPTGGPRTDVVHATAQVPFAHFEVVDEHGAVAPHQVLSSAGSLLLDQVVPKELVMAGLGMAPDGRALGYVFLNGWLSGPDTSGQATLTVTVAQQGEANVARLDQLKPQLLALTLREDVISFRAVVHEAPSTEMLVLARDIPARGGDVLYLRPRVEDAQQAPTGDDLVRVELLTLENAHLRITVNDTDGTLTLHDKRSGHRFDGLNALADSGDVGDLYTYCPPATDTLVTTPAWPPRVEIVEQGPARATLRITQTYLLPESTTPDRAAREARRVSCEVVSDVSLVTGARRAEIRTTVNNTARDHRLRALFPVPFAAQHADAEGVFEVVHRPMRQPEPAGGAAEWEQWAEVPVNTHPQKRFVDVSNGDYGLAVLNRGLPEYELIPDEEHSSSTVALTLLRCVEWLSRADLPTRKGHAGPMLHTPDAQGQRTHTFEYALVPHTGNWADEDALVQREADAFEAAMRSVTTEQHDGRLGKRWSFVDVAPVSIAVSAVKRAVEGDGLVLRLHNPTAEAVTAEVTLALPFQHVSQINLNEEPLGEIDDIGRIDAIREVSENKLARKLSTNVRMRLRGGEIVTLAFQMSAS